MKKPLILSAVILLLSACSSSPEPDIKLGMTEQAFMDVTQAQLIENGQTGFTESPPNSRAFFVAAGLIFPEVTKS